MNDVSKLPKWAQDHIRHLDKERVEARNALQRFCAIQTPTKVHYVDFVMQPEGPTVKCFVPSDRVTFTNAGVVLEVTVAEKRGIRLQWYGSDRMTNRDAALIPESHQAVWLVSRENMRD